MTALPAGRGFGPVRAVRAVALMLVSCLLAPAMAAANDGPWSMSMAYADRLKSVAGDGVCIAIAVVKEGNLERYVAGGCDSGAMYQIGNLTEVFTGLLLADAIARGEVTLETPIFDLLPDAAGMNRAVTMVHLATHFSGLPYLPDNIRMLNSDPFRNYDDRSLLSFLRRHQSNYAPGERFLYSSLGMGLLGYLLEQASGLEYGDLIEQRVSLPLGLTATMVNTVQARQGLVLQGHSNVFTPVSVWRFEVLAGAGALYSSLDDLVLLVQASLAAPQGALGQSLALTQKVQRQVLGKESGVGLGWLVSGLESPRYWHAGSTGGFKSFLGFDPMKDLGVVVLANAQISEVNELGSYLLGMTASLPEIATEDLIGPHRDLVGRYRFASDHVFRVTSDGTSLFGQSPNQTRLELTPSSQDRFQVKGSDVFVEFDRNFVGQVIQLKLLEDRRKQVAVREGMEGERELLRVSVDILDRYVGRYLWHEDNVVVVTRRDDQLLIQFEGESPIPLYAMDPTHFYEGDRNLEVTFNESKLTGQITSLTVTSQGKRRARRLPD
ncbi:MAG: serine hydrolase [Proteobacteria bacterium]|nr:serine hydrolase [Pseudomonadota bacterium]